MTRTDLAHSIHKRLIDAMERGSLPMAMDANFKINLMMALDLQCKDNQLQDMASFIGFCKDQGASDAMLIGTLMHDIGGISNEDPCFLPRTSGYADIGKWRCYACGGEVAEGSENCRSCGRNHSLN